jgi:hypothetical protein
MGDTVASGGREGVKRVTVETGLGILQEIGCQTGASEAVVRHGSGLRR